MVSKGMVATVLAAVGGVVALRTVGRPEPMDFRGRSVVITGGSRGLGLVLARQLASEGARLTLLARDQAELNRAEQELSAKGAEVLAFPCDVRYQREVESAVERIIQRFGTIDVLINNAGIIQVGPLEHMEVADFEDAMATHMWGPLYTMLASVPHMKKQGGGRIVNISSIGGKLSVPHLAPYSASKFALIGLSDGMRAELVKDKIHVTTVAPGLLRTGSHYNALFKGRNREEFSWFAIADGLPLTSISAERAAQQIIEACRKGEPELTITIQARAASIMNNAFPGLTAKLMMLTTRLLPAATPDKEKGRENHTGWESQSPLAPSPLTQLVDKAAEENNEAKK